MSQPPESSGYHGRNSPGYVGEGVEFGFLFNPLENMQHTSLHPPRGTILPLGYVTPTTFDLLQHNELTLAVPKSDASADVHRYILTPSVFDELTEELVLVFNSCLTFACVVLNHIGINYFTLKDEIPRDSKFLAAMTRKFFALSISGMRSVLLRSDYNWLRLVEASGLLNTSSILEYPEPHQSVAFSKGTIGIYSNAVNTTDPEDPHLYRLLRYVILISRSRFYPCYSANVLYEYHEQLRLMQLQHSDLFRRLDEYVMNLLRLLENNSVQSINHNPNLVYTLLRQFILITPPQASKYDDQQMVLAQMYHLLSKILDNLFPLVIHLFTVNFGCGVVLYLPLYSEVSAEQYRPVAEPLQLVQTYCIRVSTFFTMRRNMLAGIFGEQKNRDDLGVDCIPAEEVAASINEVMVDRFQKVSLGILNYPHFPMSIKISKRNEQVRDNLAVIERLQLYNYNHFHYDYLKSDSSSKTGTFLTAENSLWLHDPMLRSHVNFVVRRSKNTEDDGDKSTSPEDFGGVTSSSSYNSEFSSPTISDKDKVDNKFNWGAIIELQQSQELNELTSREYTKVLATGTRSPIATPQSKFNTKTGLSETDYDCNCITQAIYWKIFHQHKPEKINMKILVDQMYHQRREYIDMLIRQYN